MWTRPKARPIRGFPAMSGEILEAMASEADKRTLILFDYGIPTKSIEVVIEGLQSEFGDDCGRTITVVVFCTSLPKELAHYGGLVRPATEFLDPDAYAAIDEFSIQVSQQWHRVASRVAPPGALQHLGIDLGQLIEWDVHQVCNEIATITEFIRRACHALNSQVVISVGRVEDSASITGQASPEGTSVFRLAASAVSQHLGLDHRSIVLDQLSDLGNGGSPMSPANELGRSVAAYLQRWLGRAARQVTYCMDRRRVIDDVTDRGLVLATWRVDKQIAPEWRSLGSPVCAVLSVEDVPLFEVPRPRVRFGAVLPTRPGRAARRRSRAEYASRYYQSWAVVRGDVSLQRLLTFRGVPLWAELEAFFRHSVCRRFSKIAVHLDVFHSFLTRYPVRLVVVWFDVVEHHRMAVRMAQQLGIPTLYIQHGILPSTYRIGAEALTADRMAAWGEDQKAVFSPHCNDPTRIVVTGSLAMDRLREWKPTRRRDLVLADLGLDPSLKTVVFITEYVRERTTYTACHFGDVTAVALEMLLDVLEAHPGIQLVIKTRPSELPDADRKRVARRPLVKAAVTGAKASLYELLWVADATVVVSSTVGLEALELGCPVIQVNPTRAPDGVPYAESGVAARVRTRDDLDRVLGLVVTGRHLTEDADRRSTFVRGNAAFPGRAAANIANLVSVLLREERCDDLDTASPGAILTGGRNVIRAKT